MFETSLVYDQLCTTNLASLELVARQVQVIEQRFKDRFTEGIGQDYDHYLMSGTPSSQQLCISPALESWVAAEAARDTAILKERRKAREERNLVKPDDASGAGSQAKNTKAGK